MSWRDEGPAGPPLFVNARHEMLHHAGIARDILRQLPREGAVVLHHGCGEALSAGLVAAHCTTLYLCDEAPLVRSRVRARCDAESRIAVIAPDDVEALPDHGLDLVVAGTLPSSLPAEELDELLGLWHSKLKEDGRLVLADIVPHESSRRDDALALLRFAWSGGFLGAALAHLVRDALSNEAGPRPEPGIGQYGEEEIMALLAGRNFAGRRAERNMGHDQSRMTFVAAPV